MMYPPVYMVNASPILHLVGLWRCPPAWRCWQKRHYTWGFAPAPPPQGRDPGSMTAPLLVWSLVLTFIRSSPPQTVMPLREAPVLRGTGRSASYPSMRIVVAPALPGNREGIPPGGL